ncbi:MAG: hypothetical protein WCK35_15760 [Chloroflexota bacterium]
MKRFTILMLVLILSLTLVTPALAAGKPPSAKGPFALVGKISAIDPVAKTVTVQVLRGNALVKPYFSKTVIIQTTTLTRYMFTDGVSKKVITFNDLVVGKSVSIGGLLANSVWTATRITMGAKLSCLQ